MSKMNELSILVDNAAHAYIKTYYGRKAFDVFMHVLAEDAEFDSVMASCAMEGLCDYEPRATYKFGEFVQHFGTEPELLGGLVVGSPLCCECDAEAVHAVDHRDIGFGIEYSCDKAECLHYNCADYLLGEDEGE